MHWMWTAARRGYGDAGRIALITAAGALVGCATSVVSTPAALNTVSQATPAKTLVALESVEFTLPTGYIRHIEKKSRWRSVGTLPEGQVFRSADSVFTIEGRQVHEAYLVVSQGTLIGFYLPGEQRYSALGSPLPLPLGETQ